MSSDEIENICFGGEDRKFGKKELLDLKRTQSKMLREQTSLLPTYEPPKLVLDDIIAPPIKKQPKIDKTMIRNLLLEAGVDLSKTVTIGRETYETTFNRDPTPVEMLRRHNRDHVKPEEKFTRKDYKKIKMNQHNARNDKGLSSDTSSRLSELENKFWNIEQKQAQILNSKADFQQIYSDDTFEPKHQKSIDLFPVTYDLIDDEFEKKETIFSDEDEFPIKKLEYPSFTMSQDLPNLCSGKFTPVKKNEIDRDEDVMSVDVEEIEEVLDDNTDDVVSIKNDEPDISMQETPKVANVSTKENVILNFFKPEAEKPDILNVEKETVKILKPKVKKKLRMADFIEDEAEQSGSDVSLGTDGSDSEDGSLPGFVIPNQESNSSEEKEVKRAIIDDILYEDELQIEAIKNLHFPTKNKKTELDIYKEEDSDSLPEFNVISQFKEDFILFSSEDEAESGNNAMSKIRMCLSKSATSADHPNKNDVSQRPLVDEEDAIFPEYSSEHKSLLTMIKDTTSKEYLFKSKKCQPKSFLHLANNKKITANDFSDSVFHNSNSGYLFVPTDSKPSNSNKTESIDILALTSSDSTNNRKNMPNGSIFSLLMGNKN
ncbi:hypothetical protein RF11_01445 [Thelohanellus kitauei]|uniref:Uncharacterized protein n=1 Tax=Thelohanellus kitauei TaxID=669202 RepID=A0A0C2J343_THEKT|nr:hypothetical protein RF11_01445 [Thelohanellus kitauei]